MDYREIVDQMIKLEYCDESIIQTIVWETNDYGGLDEEYQKKLFDCIVEFANQGNAELCNKLGAMYAEGKLGLEKDLAKAYEWYKKSSEQGCGLGASNLGFCYMYGLGTDVNYEEAFKAFSKAVVFGIGDAIVRLGDMYLNGCYVEKDVKTAIQLYEKAYIFSKEKLSNLAGMQVYSDVCRRLGDCCANGYFYEEDHIMARHYYAEALYYYEIRETMNDPYSASGYAKTKDKLKELLNEL